MSWIEPVPLLFLAGFFVYLGEGCVRAWRARL